MNRQLFINWLHGNVPPDRREQVWWLAPTVTLLLLPVGSMVLRVLGLLGWYGAARATQGLILLSLVSGVAVGSLILWSIEEAGLEPRLLYRVKWLARFAVFGPFLTLGAMFWIASIN
jgi:hypothetical protein